MHGSLVIDEQQSCHKEIFKIYSYCFNRMRGWTGSPTRNNQGTKRITLVRTLTQFRAEFDAAFLYVLNSLARIIASAISACR